VSEYTDGMIALINTFITNKRNKGQEEKEVDPSVSAAVEADVDI
jgi:hypothetical protein